MVDKVVELCRDMVQIRSYSGEERALADYLEMFFQKEGVSVVRDECGNVIAHLQGTMPGPTVLFDGHIDTVPVENEREWTYPPFGGEIHNGCLYGRGATDMKGPLAASICGVLKYYNTCKGNFPRQIYISCVVHEECYEGVAARSVSARVKPDYVVIAEPSGMTLKLGQKGRAEIQVETFGKAAHSSNPQVGVNAVYHMLELISAVRSLPVVEEPTLGKGILELTDIVSSPYPGASVVPD